MKNSFIECCYTNVLELYGLKCFVYYSFLNFAASYVCIKKILFLVISIINSLNSDELVFLIL